MFMPVGLLLPCICEVQCRTKQIKSTRLFLKIHTPAAKLAGYKSDGEIMDWCIVQIDDIEALASELRLSVGRPDAASLRRTVERYSIAGNAVMDGMDALLESASSTLSQILNVTSAETYRLQATSITVDQSFPDSPNSEKNNAMLPRSHQPTAQNERARTSPPPLPGI